MDIINLSIFIVILINLGLVIFLFYSKQLSKSNNYFRYLGVGIILWCISMVGYRTSNENSVITWAKLLYVSASFIPSTFFIFSLVFPNYSINRFKIFSIIVINILLIFIIVFGNNIINDVYLFDNKENQIEFGKYYFLYILYTLSFFALAFRTLMFKYFKLQGVEQLQLKYIIIGSVFSANVAMIANLILPTLNIFKFNWLGQISTMIWLIFVSYAIVRYRLFDIKYLYSKVIFYTIAIIPPYLVFFSLAYIYETNFGTSLNTAAYIVGIPIAFFFAVFNKWLNNKLEAYLFERILYKGLNPYKVYNDFTKKSHHIYDLENLYIKISEIFDKYLGIKYFRIITKNEIYNDKFLEDLMVYWKNSEFEQFILQEIDYIYRNKNLEFYKVVNKYMVDNNIAIIAPLNIKNELLGIVIINNRENNQYFDIYDLEVIENFLSTMSLVVQRITLYNQIEAQNANLSQDIDKATKKIQKQVIDLEEALRKEKDMMDILGHELRTPLSTSRNAILLIDTLVNNSQDGSIKIDMIRKYVDIAKENIRREVRLLETVLSSTRIENGKMQIIYAEVEANDVVGDSITSFQEKAEQKGLKLKMKVPKHKVYVKVGREQIQEVIDNLVSNAVKYTEKGEIEVNLEENEDKVIFAVKDTGIGVPKEEIKNLGKKFHRVDMYVDSSEERNGEVKIVRPGGTGIGLYVSFELVKMMGGKVEIESEVAKGSTFKVIFPKFSK
jgi:signal transduction histidine kinase